MELFAVQDGIAQNGARYTDRQDASGHPYGIAAGESFAVGAFRSYTFLCLHEKSGGAASANQLEYRWYYTGMLYQERNVSFHGRVGMTLGAENTIRQVPVGTPLLLSVSNTRTEKQAALCVRYNGLAVLVGQAKHLDISYNIICGTSHGRAGFRPVRQSRPNRPARGASGGFCLDGGAARFWSDRASCTKTRGELWWNCKKITFIAKKLLTLFLKTAIINSSSIYIVPGEGHFAEKEKYR